MSCAQSFVQNRLGSLQFFNLAEIGQELSIKTFSTVEFRKVALTIAKEKSIHWGVFQLFFFILLHYLSIKRMY